MGSYIGRRNQYRQLVKDYNIRPLVSNCEKYSELKLDHNLVYIFICILGLWHIYLHHVVFNNSYMGE